MEVLELIYHQFFFTTTSLGCQDTKFQFFQLLASQALVLVCAAIHCVMAEYASGKMATIILAQDEYYGTFCLFSVTNFTQEATVPINHTLVGSFIHPLATLLY